MSKKTLVEIIWMDATSGRTKRKKIRDARSYLTEKRTYGKIFVEDDGAIMIETERGNGDIEYTVIPKGWIKKIRKYSMR